jgi:hypothetical protein
MIQQRLSHSIDHLLQPRQYGFRARRSLSTPLFLLRPPTEIFERHSTSLNFLFSFQKFTSLPRTIRPQFLPTFHKQFSAVSMKQWYNTNPFSS